MMSASASLKFARADSASRCAWLLFSAICMSSGSSSRACLSTGPATAMSSFSARLFTTPAGALGTGAMRRASSASALASISSIRQPMTSSNSATWSSLKTGGAVEEQSGDAAQGFGALLRRAMLDDLFQLGKQRGGNTHRTTLRNSP